MNPELAKKAGLAFAGHDEEGQAEWVGTRLAWERFEELEREYEEAQNEM